MMRSRRARVAGRWPSAFLAAKCRTPSCLPRPSHRALLAPGTAAAAASPLALSVHTAAPAATTCQQMLFDPSPRLHVAAPHTNCACSIYPTWLFGGPVSPCPDPSPCGESAVSQQR